MTTDKIKTRLEQYVTRYNEYIGSFDGLLVVSEFFEFITTEPKIKNVLKDQFNYCEQQMNIALNIPETEISQHLQNRTTFDLSQIENFKTGLFQREHADIVKMVKEYQPVNTVALEMPMALFSLSIIHGLLKQANEDANVNPQGAQENIQKLKDLSATNIPFKIVDRGEEKSVSLRMPQYYLRSLAIVGIYIVNELSAKDYLKGKKTNCALTFDKVNSILILTKKTLKSHAPLIIL